MNRKAIMLLVGFALAFFANRGAALRSGDGRAAVRPGGLIKRILERRGSLTIKLRGGECAGGSCDRP